MLSHSLSAMNQRQFQPIIILEQSFKNRLRANSFQTGQSRIWQSVNIFKP